MPFGPNQHREKLIPKTILNALNGKKIPIYGSGKNIRDWIFVDDHCSGIETVINKGHIGDSYLIGARNEKTNLEIVNLILGKLGLSSSLIEFIEDRKGHDYRYSIDPSRIEKELGWRPAHKFDEALSLTIEFYKNRSRRANVL